MPRAGNASPSSRPVRPPRPPGWPGAPSWWKCSRPGRPTGIPTTGAEITFTWRPAPGQPAVTSTLRSVALQEDPLPLVRNLVSPAGRQVAYLLFNAHTQGAQDKLIAAVDAACSRPA